VISSRKQDVCDSVAKEINDKFGKEPRLDRGEYFQQGKPAKIWSTSPIAPSQIDVLVCNAASNPYLRVRWRHFRRPVPQNSGQ